MVHTLGMGTLGVVACVNRAAVYQTEPVSPRVMGITLSIRTCVKQSK